MFLKWAYPGLFFFIFVFSILCNWQINFCQSQDSNCISLVSKATALPQPLPQLSFNVHFRTWYQFRVRHLSKKEEGIEARLTVGFEPHIFGRIVQCSFISASTTSTTIFPDLLEISWAQLLNNLVGPNLPRDLQKPLFKLAPLNF